MALGREIISCGSNVITDMEQDIPVKTAIKQRGAQTLSNLKRKVLNNMTGNGYNGIKRVKVPQSKFNTRQVRSKARAKSKPKSKPKSKSKNNSNRKPLSKKSKKTKKLTDIFGP